jgi:hypothetical protein
MVFTLVIWVFGALSLILAMLCYLLFLWHYIPNRDGGLTGYCERKINSRLAKIVSVKVNKALEEEERKRIKADAKAIKKGDRPAFGRQATLPTLFDPKNDDKLPNMPMLNSNDTSTSLPMYTSRPGTPSGQPTVPAFELDQLDNKRPFPGRSVTGSSARSNTSYASNAPLLSNSSEMGYGRSASPAPLLPSLDSNFPLGPQRTMTGDSSSSQWNRSPSSGPPRMPSVMGDRGYTQSPVSYSDVTGSQRGPSTMRQDTIDSYGNPLQRAAGDFNPRSNTPQGPPPSMGRRTPFDPNYPGARSSPAPVSEYGRNSPAPSNRGPPGPTNGYQPYKPNPPANLSNLRTTSSASPAPSASSVYSAQLPIQHRNLTDPGSRGPSAGGDYFSQSGPSIPVPQIPGTPASGRGAQNGQRLGSGGSGYGQSEGPPRLASPAPYINNGNGMASPAGGPSYRR